MYSIDITETSDNSQTIERTESSDSNCELEYCYDDLNLKFENSPTKYKNNSDFSRELTLPEYFKVSSIGILSIPRLPMA